MKNSEISAVLTFMRHGQKDEAGDLTGLGHSQSKTTGIKTKHLEGDIILFHSGVGRVKNTVRTMASHLHLCEEQEELLEAGENMADYIVPDLHYLIDPNIKGEYFSHWDDIDGSADSIEARIAGFLSFEKSPEPNIFYSPKIMAKNIAKIIDTEARFANLTDDRYRVNFVNGSHEPVLMSFLLYFLNDYQPNGVEIIKKIGGTIDFAEGFDILVMPSGDNHDYFFKFRDIEKEIDMDVLRRFAYTF